MTAPLHRRLLPAALRRVLNDGLALAALPRLMRLAAHRPPPGAPRVWYGRRVPLAHEQAESGIVKMQRLQPALPDSPAAFNVLYMVSSAMPRAGPMLARLARARGVRIAWNQNGVAYPGWHGDGWERTNAPMVRMLALADHVFYQSQFCRRSADRFLGPPRGASEILYNPVDTSVFTPAAAREPGPAVILLGGTQYQRYRLDCAVRALATLRRSGVDARLVVTGRLSFALDATAYAAALVRAEGVEPHVTLAGPYTQAAAPDVMRQGDVLLHPKYNDPSPGVVVEAMACGLPVVYSASGGVPELVGGDAGIGIAAEERWDVDLPPDPDALADALREVLRDRARFAAAARARAVSRFDLAPWIARHVDVFTKLLA